MIIYKITNTVNNKIYIGMTTRLLEERWHDHIIKTNSKYANKYYENDYKK